MDSITQAVLGASIQGAMLGRWQGRKALLCGAMLGTLPDLDVVIDYGDAVAQMTYHRGFSHSLFVLSGVALLLTWLVRRWRPNPGYTGARMLLTIWLILVTHTLLDSFTSYGTQLLWPLTSPPIAWASIFIIDPLYTLPLLGAVLVGAVIGLGNKGLRWQYGALGLSSLYLAFTLAGQQMAEHRVQQALIRDGIQAEAMFSTPTPFNSLLWRVIVLDGERYHEALVSWLDPQPPVLQSLPRGLHWRESLRDSPQHARLEWFSRGILRYDRIGDQLVVTDLRMGMAGYHPFRFPMAEWRDDQWQPIAWVERRPMQRSDTARLLTLWHRIWNPQENVPVMAWAEELRR
ncbi:metal-dependent hydrolase [Pseudomonas sp.]|uniref:metal-dependent hydrolase n=1 Tax=Pseudomonas sp. TaxID=306 RepID=UPI0019DFF3C1|nr:metal-dependent hydrolase [Pseudomonas sp.]MBF0673813.1 metal-dependent hydrolase [Pseudomonas sp.]